MRASRRTCGLCVGQNKIIGDLPEPGKLATGVGGPIAIEESSGSVNRQPRPPGPSALRSRRPPGRAHDRGRCPLYVRAQLETAGLPWTQRDITGPNAAARESGKTPGHGPFPLVVAGVGFEPT